MADQEHYGIRDYLEAAFKGVHDKLDSIEKQTTKTNGRVDDHADKISKMESYVKWIPWIGAGLTVVVLYLVGAGVIPPNAFK